MVRGVVVLGNRVLEFWVMFQGNQGFGNRVEKQNVHFFGMIFITADAGQDKICSRCFIVIACLHDMGGFFETDMALISLSPVPTQI
jgi:hypothetical protein